MATEPGWHFLAGGVRQGPVSEAVLRGLVAGGGVPGDAMVQTPAGEWLSASAAPELLAPPPEQKRDGGTPQQPQRRATPAKPPVQIAPVPDIVTLEPATTAPLTPLPPELWNPNAAANWSLVFTPVLGALLHAANWRALGDPRRARANVAWAWVTLAAVAGAVATSPAGGMLVPRISAVFAWVVQPVVKPGSGEPSFCHKLFQVVCVLLLFFWYFAQAQSQTRRVKRLYGNRYRRRGWGYPLAIAVAGLIAVFLAASVAGLVNALWLTTVAAEVRADVREVRSRWPVAGTVAIRQLALRHRGGGKYAGFVGATVGGRPTHRVFVIKLER